MENTSINQYPNESNNAYYNRIIDRYENLSKFYNSRRWDLRKAEVGEYDREVHGFLQSVNGKLGKKYKGTNPPMFFFGNLLDY